MSTTVTAEQFLARSIRLATANVLNSGGPFGAMIVTADGKTFDGVNRVTADNDPTAHAEVTAIRTACRELGTFDLSGAVLYTSCEPCPMCLASALWARVERVVFAADRHDAASVGFDDAVFYEYFDNQDRDCPDAGVQAGTGRSPGPGRRWSRSTPGTRSNPGLTTRARWLT